MKIHLGRGKFTLIDEEDAPLVSPHKWYAIGGSRAKVYAARGVCMGRGKVTTVLLHRLLLAAPPEMSVDHISGDTLDNRRANLRLATTMQNCANNARLPGQTGYRGVIYRRNRYWASIKINGRNIYVGCSEDPEEAARMWDEKAREFRGEFARVNFPRAGERGLS